MKQKILVVGGLAAGPGAASKAKRINPDAEVTLFEKGEHISYGICEIPYFIGGVVTDPGKLVSYSPLKLEKEKGVKVKTFHSVEEIHPVKKLITVRDLQKGKLVEYGYDRLVLATGSKVRSLGMSGEHGRNVFHVKSLDDGFAIRKLIESEHPRKAVIVGGGYVGMEMADALVNCGIETTVLHRYDLPMSRLEPETRALIRNELDSHGVRFVPKANVKEFKADSTGKVTEVVTSDGTYSTDMVVLSIGVEPNVELAEQAGIRIGKSRGILTDQKQSTGNDGMYAAGDCCEVKNVVNNRWMYIPLATIAARQAWVAGENAAGGNAEFKGAIRALALKIFDLHVAQVGLSSAEAHESGFQIVVEHIESNSRIGYYPGNSRLHITAIADRVSGRLLGANVAGGDGVALRANTLGVALQHRLTVEDIARFDLMYAPPFAPLWDPILVMANQVKKKLKERK